MRFERDAPEEQPPIETGNRWYFFIPLLIVALWLLVDAAQLVASTLAPSGAIGGSEDAAERLRDALAMMDWIGDLGWLLLFPFYLVVLASKRARSASLGDVLAWCQCLDWFIADAQVGLGADVDFWRTTTNKA